MRHCWLCHGWQRHGWLGPPGLHPRDWPVVGVPAGDEGSQLGQRLGQGVMIVGHHDEPETVPTRGSAQFVSGQALGGDQAIGGGSTDHEDRQVRHVRHPEIGSAQLPGQRGDASPGVGAPPAPSSARAGCSAPQVLTELSGVTVTSPRSPRLEPPNATTAAEREKTFAYSLGGLAQCDPPGSTEGGAREHEVGDPDLGLPHPSERAVRRLCFARVTGSAGVTASLDVAVSVAAAVPCGVTVAMTLR